MKLHRVVVSWAGPTVKGNAVNVLHYDGTNQSAPPVAAILAAYTRAKQCFPTGTTITVPGFGDTIDDTTGALVGSWSSAGGGSTGCTGVASAPAGVGACLTWFTTTIVNGKKGPRHLRGRTFLVPMGGDAYDAQGTLQDGYVSTLATFGTDMVAAGAMAVWHRPTTKGGSDGTSGPVSGSRVRDHVAFLSSRRD